MSYLDIVLYPDKILRAKAAEVKTFNEDLKVLTHNMIQTMYHAPGIGLAAPQINVSQRIFVLDVDYTREEDDEGNVEKKNFNPQIMINPKIISHSGTSTYQEGCLSLPGVFENVDRPAKVVLQFQDIHSKWHEVEADGLYATCIQHELDHLDGIMFIDHLSQLKRNFHLKQYKKNLKK